MYQIIIFAVLVGALVFLFFQQEKLEGRLRMMKKEMGVLYSMVRHLDGSEPYMDPETGDIVIPKTPEIMSM